VPGSRNECVNASGSADDGYGDPVTAGAAPPAPNIHWGSTRARWIMLATVLGSGLSMLDSTVVNVALPALGAALDASLGDLQWVVNGYTLSLAALILLGGSLGDRFGRRRIFLVGVVWFAAGSLLCGLSPTIGWLIAARILQGVGGALLVPGSLAIISASFVRADRARAIGAWSALAGVATAAGPLLGGWMVETIGWRWVFLINLPLAVVVLVVTLRQVPETADPSAPRSFDIAGAALGALGLAALTYALIGADDGWTLDVVAVLTLGVAALVAFVVVERRGRHPMLPMDIFESRQFSAANLVTLLVYAALGALFFLLVVQLQVVAGLGPLAAGSALLPITIIMLLLSGASGQLAERIGPRLPMTVGPLLAGVGSLLLLRVGPDTSYATDVLPAVVVIGLGLALTVAPLTATVLAAAEDRHAGIASGVNNAVARAGGLLAVAAIPVLVGLTGDAYDRPIVFDAGFDRAMIICAVLFTVGGVLSLLTIRAPLAERGGGELAAEPTPPTTAGSRLHCGVGAPPLTRHSTREG
jgi:EmrB/QacA subfamily drug resistance transporter